MYPRIIKKSIAPLLILFALLSGVSPGFAGTTGKLSGKVRDAATNEPLIGASVFILGTEKGAATDVDGEFFILNLQPGFYTIRISSVGYTTKIIEKVRIQVDLTTKLDMDLNSQDIELGEEILVTADRVIQKDLTSSERTLQSDLISDLPARDVSSLLSIQAGVTKDSDGQLHIRGGRSSEISYMVDGVVVQNPLDRNNAGISIDDQSIAELKAITGTFNAEYGQALSGVVNIVTKNGGDKFNFGVTAYTGDHFSTDTDTYRLMSNRDWANAIAFYQVNGKRLFYDFSRYGLNSIEEARTLAASGEKPWQTYESYLDSYNPVSSFDVQFNSSGPLSILNKNLSFYAAGRYQNRPGYQMGRRYFMPWGYQRPFTQQDRDFDNPDGELVHLDWYKGYSTQTKLFWDSPTLDLSYGLFFNNDHSYYGGQKYLPDGGKNYYTNRFTHIFSATYILTPETFIDYKGNYYYSHHENYLYESPTDYRYVPQNSGDYYQWAYGFGGVIESIPSDFSTWGNDVSRGENIAEYYGSRIDLTSQVDKYNMVKMGISGTYHNISNEYYSTLFTINNDRQVVPFVPESSFPSRTYYTANPLEIAAYIQDKIEYEELIINFGLRFDYFDPDGRVLADSRDPQIYNPFLAENKYKNYDPLLPVDQLVEYSIAEREKFWFKKVDAKYQISPRIGISFPVTAEGVIHFSYGHFFQNPEFQYLYANPNFWVDGQYTQNLVGNADLKPERTTMYELGLNQRIAGAFDVSVTGFYRDIKDWVGTGSAYDTYKAGVTYIRYENKDHATVKGITLSGNQSAGDFYYSIDYTYQEAKGTSSNAQQAYYDALANRPPRLRLISLNWDQTHAVNLLTSYSSDGWSASVIGKLGSGFPYSPTFARNEEVGSSGNDLPENSERRPWTFNLDLRLSKTTSVGLFDIQYFLDITNLLDTRNANSVYSDTGLPDETFDDFLLAPRLEEIGNSKEYFANPGRYSSPRFIQIGLRFQTR